MSKVLLLPLVRKGVPWNTPLKKTTFPPEFCNEICTIYVWTIKNYNSAKTFWKCCTVTILLAKVSSYWHCVTLRCNFDSASTPLHFELKSILALWGHPNAVTSQSLCGKCSKATQHNAILLWTELYNKKKNRFINVSYSFQ